MIDQIGWIHQKSGYRLKVNHSTNKHVVTNIRDLYKYPYVHFEKTYATELIVVLMLVAMMADASAFPVMKVIPIESFKKVIEVIWAHF